MVVMINDKQSPLWNTCTCKHLVYNTTCIVVFMHHKLRCMKRFFGMANNAKTSFVAKPYLVKRVSWSQTSSILNYWYLQNLPKYVSTEAQKEILTLLLRIHELEIQNIEYQSQLYLREHDLSQKDFIISRYQNYRSLAEELISQQRELINGKLIVWFNVDHLVLKHLLHLWFTVLALNWWSENVGFIGIVCRMIHVHMVINQFSDRGFPSWCV